VKNAELQWLLNEGPMVLFLVAAAILIAKISKKLKQKQALLAHCAEKILLKGALKEEKLSMDAAAIQNVILSFGTSQPERNVLVAEAFWSLDQKKQHDVQARNVSTNNFY